MTIPWTILAPLLALATVGLFAAVNQGIAIIQAFTKGKTARVPSYVDLAYHLAGLSAEVAVKRARLKVVSFERAYPIGLSSERIIRFDDGSAYRGSGTVWYRSPSGERCSTPTEEWLCLMARRAQWAEEERKLEEKAAERP